MSSNEAETRRMWVDPDLVGQFRRRAESTAKPPEAAPVAATGSPPEGLESTSTADPPAAPEGTEESTAPALDIETLSIREVIDIEEKFDRGFWAVLIDLGNPKSKTPRGQAVKVFTWIVRRRTEPDFEIEDVVDLPYDAAVRVRWDFIDPPEQVLVPVDMHSLTVGEVDEIETLAGASMSWCLDNLHNPETRLGGFALGMAYVVRRHDDPLVTLADTEQLPFLAVKLDPKGSAANPQTPPPTMKSAGSGR